MSSGEPDEEQKGSAFTHRLEMLKELVEAPDEAIEALYNSYGKTMFTNAGGAAVSYTHLTLPTIDPV